jgi:hypothetical protein
MSLGRSVALFVVLGGLGCATQRSPSSSVAPAAAPATTPAPTASIGASIAAHRSDARNCAASLPIPSVQGSLALPPALVRSSLEPSYVALCACMDPGASSSVHITVKPDDGSSLVAVDDPALQSCVDAELGDGRFPPFHVGSDCIDCGPKHYGVFSGSAPPKPPSSSVTFALAFTRP